MVVDQVNEPWVQHMLKCLPEYFEPLRAGIKTFELRRNDRNFTVGDIIRFCEWSPTAGYSNRNAVRIVTFVLAEAEAFGLKKGYVVLGLKEVQP